MAKRLFALLLAVGLVLAAIVLRTRLDDDGGDNSTDGPTTTAPEGELPTVTCATELVAACDALAAQGLARVTIEPAGTTTLALARGDAPPDAWITIDPLPEIVDARRDRAGEAAVLAEPVPLASSPLVVAGRPERIELLTRHCGGSLTWRCLGELAGEGWDTVGGSTSWGRIRPAHENPVTSAAGLLVFGNAVASWFGTTDVGTNEFQNDDQFRRWLTQLESSIPFFGDGATTPFDRLLLLPEPHAVGTTQAEVRAKAGSQSDRVATVYPGPMARADAVLAPAEGRTLSNQEELVVVASEALTTSGWDDPTDAASTGLPPAGALEALQTLWQEVTR